MISTSEILELICRIGLILFGLFYFFAMFIFTSNSLWGVLPEAMFAMICLVVGLGFRIINNVDIYLIVCLIGLALGSIKIIDNFFIPHPLVLEWVAMDSFPALCFVFLIIQKILNKEDQGINLLELMKRMQ